MKAVIITSYGEPSVLQLQERAQPEIGARAEEYKLSFSRYLHHQYFNRLLLRALTL